MSEISAEYAEAVTNAKTVDLSHLKSRGETSEEDDDDDMAPMEDEEPDEKPLLLDEEEPKDEPMALAEEEPDEPMLPKYDPLNGLNPFGKLAAKLAERKTAPEEEDEEAKDEEAAVEQSDDMGSVKSEQSEPFDKGTLSDYEQLSEVGYDDALLETPKKETPQKERSEEARFEEEENLAANDDYLGAPELESELEEAKRDELRRKAFTDVLEGEGIDAPKVSNATGKARVGPIPNKELSDDSDDELPIPSFGKEPPAVVRRPVTRRVTQPPPSEQATVPPKEKATKPTKPTKPTKEPPVRAA